MGREQNKLTDDEIRLEQRTRYVPINNGRKMFIMPALSNHVGAYVTTGVISGKLDSLLDYCDEHYYQEVRRDSVLVGMGIGLDHEDYPKDDQMIGRLHDVRVLSQLGRKTVDLAKPPIIVDIHPLT